MIEDKALTFRDFADSLKIEVSDIPPSKDKYIKEFVLEVRAVVERKYGKYFGPHTLNRVRRLEERVVSFCPGSFSEYVSLMDPQLKGAAKKIMGAHVSEDRGNTVGIQSRKFLMRDKSSSEIVNNIVSSVHISRKDAISII